MIHKELRQLKGMQCFKLGIYMCFKLGIYVKGVPFAENISPRLSK